MTRMLALTLSAFFLSGSVVSATAAAVPQGSQFSPPDVFHSEGAAQEGCPKDSVVWLNTNTGIYHRLSVRRYGRTHRGGYVCESAAIAAGAHVAEGKDR